MQYYEMTLTLQGIRSMQKGHQTNHMPLIQTRAANGSAGTGENKMTSP